MPDPLLQLRAPVGPRGTREPEERVNDTAVLNFLVWGAKTLDSLEDTSSLLGSFAEMPYVRSKGINQR